MARPDHPLLLLSGDGSAGFTLAEIETALRFRTPYVAVVAHDAAWGIEADGRPEERRQGTTLGEIRFDRVCQALGGRGVYIEHPEQIAPAIEEGLAADRVTFIHVPTQMAGIGHYERYFCQAG
jgi:acetolactate synthase-1/2/3 large subunit